MQNHLFAGTPIARYHLRIHQPRGDWQRPLPVTVKIQGAGQHPPASTPAPTPLGGWRLVSRFSGWLTRILFGPLALLMGFILAAPAETTSFHSGIQQVSLLELYSSEGCSSCPPADAWLNQLKTAPGLWKHFAPVAFHVDYWNSLGWRDPWSAPEFTERQWDYARAWQASEVYTPEFVLNGTEWRNWFGLRGEPTVSRAQPGELELATTNNTIWSVRFTPTANTNDHYVIHAALLANGLNSAVKAGENRGRTLAHEFTALELVQIGLTTSNGVVQGKFIWNFSRYATTNPLAVTAWMTRAGNLTPVQAVGGWLLPASAHPTDAQADPKIR